MEHALVTQPKFTNQKFLIDYDTPQLALIKNTYAAKATAAEFELLMYQSRIYGLDILTRKIWCVKYGNSPAQIFAGRDGFLEIAHRDPNFDGIKTTVEEIPKPFTVRGFRWEGYGDSARKVTFEKTFDTQFVATCQVFRKDKSRPFEVTVYEEEYSTGMDNWEKKRRTMISKVADSQGLRKAFSISGMYAPEEMGDDAPAAPDMQTATVVEEKKPAAVDGTTPLPLAEDVEAEDAKRRKHLRGKLNQALLACKDVKAYNKAWKEFNLEHGKAIWANLTGHNAVETFDSLAAEHLKRVTPDPQLERKESWPKRMAAAPDHVIFKELQDEYIANPEWESTTNNDIINDKGAELGIPGYEREA